MAKLSQPLANAQARVTQPRTLDYVFRLTDDLTIHHAIRVARNLGGDPSRILECWYGLPTASFAREFRPESPIRRGSIILPCRNAHGAIIALHDDELRWLTKPSTHTANARAATAGIQICETTAEADSIALDRNICCIARNGRGADEVQAALLALTRADNSRVLARAA